MHLIVAPQLSGGWRHNHTTKTAQELALPMSSLSILLSLWGRIERSGIKVPSLLLIVKINSSILPLAATVPGISCSICLHLMMFLVTKQLSACYRNGQFWSHFYNNLFSSKLTSEPNKLECLSLASLSSLV